MLPDIMTAALTFLVAVSAAFGSGAMILRLTGTLHGFVYIERLAVSFALGIGAIGWCVFFLALCGQVSSYQLLACLAVLASGVLLLRPQAGQVRTVFAAGIWRISLLGAIGLALGYDVLEGLAPPVDGDSLAYHFTLAKSFLGHGGLFPVYQAIEGTIPLLQQMTYLAALGIGGEQALTLWTMASGWSASALVYVIARRYLGINWALAIALVFLTTPAVIYGAGSGQNEIRNASFVLVAAMAIVEARRTGLLRYAVLGGLAAGFFMASKYTGLIFAFAAGLVLLLQKRWFVHGLVYSIALFLAGAQWYAWNLWLTGDPVFPVLYGKIDYLPSVPWSDTLQRLYTLMISEKPIPANLFWYVFYPLKATLFADPAFESMRVGYGPIVLLLMPMALFGLWHFRDRIRAHPLMGFGAICLLVYTIWFFIGPSQRVRHMLPIYPLLLLCVSVSAVRLAQAQSSFRPTVYLAFALVIPLHLVGATLFALNYGKYAFSNETRESFLTRTLSQYGAVPPTNRIISEGDRLLVDTRQLVYYLKGDVFYANPNQQAIVETHSETFAPKSLWKQLQQQKITHILLPFDLKQMKDSNSYKKMMIHLRTKNCLHVIDSFAATSIASRTLPALGRSDSWFTLVELTPRSCGYAKES